MRLHPEKNPLLGHLPDDVMQELLSGAKVEKFKEGDVLVTEGDPSDSIFFVTWGEVAILKGEFEIDRSRTGSVIGEMGVLTKSPRSATIKTCGEVETLKIMADDFNAVLDGHPAMLRSLLFEQMGKVTSSHQVRKTQQSAIAKVESMLSKLVSPQVRDRVLKDSNPEELLKGTLNETAILFFDIRGFSSAAEKVSTSRVANQLP